MDKLDPKDIKVTISKVANIVKCPIEVCFALANYEFSIIKDIKHKPDVDVTVLRILKTALFCAEKHIRLAITESKSKENVDNS